MSFIKNFHEYLNESTEISYPSSLWSGNIYDDGMYQSQEALFKGIPDLTKFEQDFEDSIPLIKNPQDVVYFMLQIGADGTVSALSFMKNGEVLFTYSGENEEWRSLDVKWNPNNRNTIVRALKTMEDEIDDDDDEDGGEYDYSSLREFLKKSRK